MGEEKPQEVALVPTTEHAPALPEQSVAPSVEMLMGQAIEKGITPETMEKFLAMRRELRAEAAKEAFDRDMALCQADLPIIEKTKEAKDEGKLLYKYAPIDEIIRQCGPVIAKHGFSYSFKTINTPALVKVIVIVKHKGGHSEESEMETSLATKTRIMSGPQQIAATVTFNKRYAFCNAFGITTGDEDTDGPAGKGEPVLATMEQKEEIYRLAQEIAMPMPEVGKRCREKYGVDFGAISNVQADGIIAGLKQRKAPASPSK